MDLLVPLQQVLLNEAHVTLTAPKRPLTCAIKSTTAPPQHINDCRHPTRCPICRRSIPSATIQKAREQRKPLTCVYEHVSAQVVGAAEGGVAVLANVRFGVGGQAGSVGIQHRGLSEDMTAAARLRTARPTDRPTASSRNIRPGRNIFPRSTFPTGRHSLSIGKAKSHASPVSPDGSKAGFFWGGAAQTFAASLRFLRALPPCPSPLVLLPLLAEASFGSLAARPDI